MPGLALSQPELEGSHGLGLRPFGSGLLNTLKDPKHG